MDQLSENYEHDIEASGCIQYILGTICLDQQISTSVPLFTGLHKAEDHTLKNHGREH
jgi:hypothetical protein